MLEARLTMTLLWLVTIVVVSFLFYLFVQYDACWSRSSESLETDSVLISLVDSDDSEQEIGELV